MRNLEKLKKYSDNQEEYLNRINQDIKDLESELKRSGLRTFYFKPYADIDQETQLSWCSADKRLFWIEENCAKPLIEWDIITRIRSSIYLDKFIELILEKNGVTND